MLTAAVGGMPASGRLGGGAVPQGAPLAGGRFVRECMHQCRQCHQAQPGFAAQLLLSRPSLRFRARVGWCHRPWHVRGRPVAGHVPRRIACLAGMMRGYLLQRSSDLQQQALEAGHAVPGVNNNRLPYSSASVPVQRAGTGQRGIATAQDPWAASKPPDMGSDCSYAASLLFPGIPLRASCRSRWPRWPGEELSCQDGHTCSMMAMTGRYVNVYSWCN